MQLTRPDAMTTALSLLAQYNTGAEVIELTIPGDWQTQSHNLILRMALRTIGDYQCQCADLPADDGDLCAACFAKSMLEPMPADRLQQVFRVQPDDDIDCPPGAVPSVAGAVEDGPIFDD